MYKKAWCTWKVVVLLIKPLVFLLSRYRPRCWILKSLNSARRKTLYTGIIIHSWGLYSFEGHTLASPSTLFILIKFAERGTMLNKTFNGPVKVKKRPSSLIRKRSTFLWDIKNIHSFKITPNINGFKMINSYSLKWSRDWANIHYEVLFGCLFHFCFYRWLGALLSGRGEGGYSLIPCNGLYKRDTFSGFRYIKG